MHFEKQNKIKQAFLLFKQPHENNYMVKKELFWGMESVCPFALEGNQELTLKDNWQAIWISEGIFRNFSRGNEQGQIQFLSLR